MIQGRRSLLFLAAVLIIAALAPQVKAQQAAAPLTNRDIVKMVKGGVPESVIISSIQSSASNFDLTPDALIRLHRDGIPKKIMDAMMAASTKPGTSDVAAPAPEAPNGSSAPPADSSSAAPNPSDIPSPNASAIPDANAAPASAAMSPASIAAPGLPSVMLLQGGSTLPIAIEKTQLEETKTKPSSLLSLASDSALTPVVSGEVNQTVGDLANHIHSSYGGASVAQAGGLFSGILARRKPDQTYIWAVPNPASSNVLPTSTPSFLVEFSNVPGVNTEEYKPEIVKLTPAQNTWRLVGATEGKEDATSSSSLNWEIYAKFLEDPVILRSQKKDAGLYQISPASPLLPGEYAVVLRPVSKSKKFSGADVARGQGDGLVFDSVWSFQVPPGAQPQ